MSSDDRMTFHILEDGTVVTKVDGISSMNHASADALVKGIDGLLAGKVSIQRRGESHAHAHEHAHDHDKEGA